MTFPRFASSLREYLAKGFREVMISMPLALPDVAARFAAIGIVPDRVAESECTRMSPYAVARIGLLDLPALDQEWIVSVRPSGADFAAFLAGKVPTRPNVTDEIRAVVDRGDDTLFVRCGEGVSAAEGAARLTALGARAEWDGYEDEIAVFVAQVTPAQLPLLELAWIDKVFPGARFEPVRRPSGVNPAAREDGR